MPKAYFDWIAFIVILISGFGSSVQATEIKVDLELALGVRAGTVVNCGAFIYPGGGA